MPKRSWAAATWDLPARRNIAIFPAVTLNPPWTKKYFMTIQAIQLMGGNKLIGLGLFKGQSMIRTTFQYNFNLL